MTSYMDGPFIVVLDHPLIKSNLIIIYLFKKNFKWECDELCPFKLYIIKKCWIFVLGMQFFLFLIFFLQHYLIFSILHTHTFSEKGKVHISFLRWIISLYCFWTLISKPLYNLCLLYRLYGLPICLLSEFMTVIFHI